MGILREMDLGIRYDQQDITRLLSTATHGRDISEYFCIVCYENNHDLTRFISLHRIECIIYTVVTGSSDNWSTEVENLRNIVKKKKPFLVVVKSVNQWSTSQSNVFEGGDILIDIQGNIRFLNQL